MDDITPLPAGVRSRRIDGVNGLDMHILEAGGDEPARPLVLLLHGFPELAYSWRKVLPALAAAGYWAVAPDQRGYGRTTGWQADYDGDLRPFGYLNLVRDALALVFALGRREVACLVGHDFGSPVSAAAALIRPDVFTRVVLMSAPFSGPPPHVPAAPSRDGVHAALAALSNPRKHYQWYYSALAADADMHDPPQGLHDFLRAYYHMKSADWPANRPYELAAWNAEELAKLPTYYVMELDRTMPETVAPEMPDAACDWLSEAELAVYAAAFAETGFQGGLNWYRCNTGGLNAADMTLYSGRRIDIPSLFIAGASDWGIHQSPGALVAMQTQACSDMRGCRLIEGAGHWVQQERAAEVSEALLAFLDDTQQF